MTKKTETAAPAKKKGGRPIGSVAQVRPSFTGNLDEAMSFTSSRGAKRINWTEVATKIGSEPEIVRSMSAVNIQTASTWMKSLRAADATLDVRKVPVDLSGKVAASGTLAVGYVVVARRPE
jgi:hypothetical protein